MVKKESMRRIRWTLVFALFFVACETPSKLKGIECWHYQLQDYSKDFTISDRVGLLIVDAFRDDQDQVRRFSQGEVTELKKRRTVLSYLSVGEAEDYRSYWKKLSPGLILRSNPQWKGNYLVKFWQSQWKEIIFGPAGELKEILNQGFDGVYLDRVDVCFEILAQYPNACEEMARFVIELKASAQKIRSDALVMVQNAPCILGQLSTATQKEYLAAVDGLGVESLISPELQSADLKCVLDFQSADKPIFSIEYPELSKSFSSDGLFQAVKAAKMVGFQADRALNGKKVVYPKECR